MGFSLSSQQQILDNYKKVCLCRSITGGTIMKAMQEGHLTLSSLRRKLGVTTGNCQGKRCKSKLEERLKEYKASHPPAPTG